MAKLLVLILHTNDPLLSKGEVATLVEQVATRIRSGEMTGDIYTTVGITTFNESIKEVGTFEWK